MRSKLIGENRKESYQAEELVCVPVKPRYLIFPGYIQFVIVQFWFTCVNDLISDFPFTVIVKMAIT